MKIIAIMMALSSVGAFVVPSGLIRPSTARGAVVGGVTNPYADELIATANAMVAPGKGLLAIDESTGTIGKRFEPIGVENTPVTRRTYREMLFRTGGVGEYISGAITYPETLLDVALDGKTTMVELMNQAGIIPGVKVDTGVVDLPGTNGEQVVQGMDGLNERCASYYKAGARFAKWRAVLCIKDSSGATPSPLSIKQNCETLARYASICQMNGLVPIVEPEILMDGEHTIEFAAATTERVLAAVYKELNDHHVLLEGSLLKPNMVRNGVDCPQKATPAEIASTTVRTLQRTVPAAVPGITFLSGGMSEEEATVSLNEMNKLDAKKPWSLTFSYGRALQQSCLKAWLGKDENKENAQKELYVRAKSNSLANLGTYNGEGAGGAAAPDSSYVKNYSY
jgi:fructose-bisphosphate aldolase class I